MKKQTNQATLENPTLVFQEVEVRRLDPIREGENFITKFEKHKVLRQKVKITQEEADRLNTGRVQHDANKFFVLYLLPDQEVAPLTRKINKG